MKPKIARIQQIMPAPGWRCFACTFNPVNEKDVFLDEFDSPRGYDIEEVPVVGWAIFRETGEADDDVRLLFGVRDMEFTCAYEKEYAFGDKEAFQIVPPGRDLDKQTLLDDAQKKFREFNKKRKGEHVP